MNKKIILTKEQCDALEYALLSEINKAEASNGTKDYIDNLKEVYFKLKSDLFRYDRS